MGVISSAVLAGVAKVALVVVSIGGLTAGAYFAYQTTQGDADTVSGQIEPTAAVVSSPTLAPTAIATQPASTLTPAPTLAAIDTSDWVTYSRDSEFSLRYPPDWTVLEPADDWLPVRILNEQAAAESARRVREGIKEFPTLQPGEAWIEIGPGPLEPFDVDAFSILCSGPIAETVFKGLRAAQCDSKMWIERPDGSILRFATVNIGRDMASSEVIELVRSTLVPDFR